MTLESSASRLSGSPTLGRRSRATSLGLSTPPLSITGAAVTSVAGPSRTVIVISTPPPRARVSVVSTCASR
jgi:hypothetical protein